MKAWKEREYQRKYRLTHKERLRAKRKANEIRIKAYNRKYYLNNKKEIRRCNDAWSKKNKEKHASYAAKYRRENKELCRMRVTRWYKKNKAKIRVARTQKRKTDPIFRLAVNCRIRIRDFLKGNFFNKTKKTFQMIGCSPQELMEHLSNQFTSGMTRENHGLWHVDHIIPLATAKTQEEVEKLCHYTNLQPLWAADNLRKGAKLYPLPHKPELCSLGHISQEPRPLEAQIEANHQQNYDSSYVHV